MTLDAGSRLGPYEISGQIGAGGMGEVYRAKDPRLGRDVAIKVLPASFSADADRLRRFEQEARAAGVLNHPNITAVYDIGSADGAPYVVQELLEGETLRSALAGGRLSTRKTIDYSLQIAHGLAAAHAKGIVHRDLKPENLFVTTDGRVKILDFGLAKLTHQEEGSQATNLPTETKGTEPGVVLGTLGYMSPEQVRGRAADARSDIFSFGAILYEMLSGQRAFHGDSAADTMSAILREDPPDLSVTNQGVSPGLERIVRHCLEKNSEQRFQSARDLAFALQEASGSSGAPLSAAPSARTRRFPRIALAGALVPILLAIAFWAGRWLGRPREESLHRRVTFRQGNVLSARFTADGQSVAYSAAWGNQPAELFLARVGSRESRPLGITNANVLGVSPTDELAILLKKAYLFGTSGTGTLARVPIGGGAPRQVLEDVYAADWSPDGKNLAALRSVGGQGVLEYPIGKRLSVVDVDLDNIRLSPDGSLIAGVVSSGTPSIVVYDLAGKRRSLASGYIFLDSLAWAPSGREIWFDGVAADKSGAPYTGLFAVDLAGHTRTVTRTTDLESIHDIARDGRVLVEREIGSREMLFAPSDSGAAAERNLSWLNQSNIAVVSNDGKTLLFDESGEAGGTKGSVYLRTTDGAAAVRLGDGIAQDLSFDGRWALTMSSDGASFVLLPTGPGEPRTLAIPGMRAFAGRFLPPDGKEILFPASESGSKARVYVMNLEGGKPRAFTPEGLTDGAAVSPDGKIAAFTDSDNRPTLYPLAGGEPKVLPGLEARDVPIQWSADGGFLYVKHKGEVPLRIYRYSLAAATRTLWKELVPADRTGLVRLDNVSVTPDGKFYAYTVARVTDSDLYVVTGWK